MLPCVLNLFGHFLVNQIKDDFGNRAFFDCQKLKEVSSIIFANELFNFNVTHNVLTAATTWQMHEVGAVLLALGA